MAGGRPSFEPTAQQRSQVTMLAAVGTRHEIIARHLGIDRKTLRKHFKSELKEGRTDANALVAKSLFASAINGNIVAQIFWLKTRANWRETSVNEITGPDGERLFPQPINLDISFADGAPGMPRVERESQTDRTGVLVTPAADHADGVDVETEVAVEVILREPAALEAPRPAEPRRMPKPMSAAAEWEALGGGEGSDT